MWFNQPVYNSYTPYGYGHGYSSFEDPSPRAIARERAARQREAAARRAEYLRWQQMQDAARPPYNSYLSDDDEDSFTSYPYYPHANDYAIHEDPKRRQVLERHQQLEMAHQAELSRRREAERVRELAEHSSKARKTKPTQLPKYPSPSHSPTPVTPEATPERIRAAMAIQEFYRNRMARRQALSSIAELSTQFEQFKSAFSPPPQLDYRGATPDDLVTIPVSSESFVHALSITPSSGDAEETTSKSNPRLAFTSNNKVVLEYVENLNRLIDKLDRIESGGHPSVREQRKQMIRNVEEEAQRMDRWIAAVWKLAHPPAQTRLEHQSSRQLRPQPTMEDVFASN